MSHTLQQRLLFALALVPAIALALPTISIPHPADPFADPAHDPYNPLRYIPNNVLTAVATALVAIVALSQVYMTIKYHIKWLLIMTLGCFTFCFGLATRFAFAKHPESKGIYIAEYLLVVLSPCAFIAGTYVVLGRLARYLRADQYLLIRPSRVTLTFVLSDIVTFVIQAIGGTVAIATEDPDKIKLGGNLFKAGIILQFVSFAFFTMLLIVFTTRVYKNERAIWTADKDAGKKWSHDWRALLGVMFVACVTILIRSAYRTAEAAEGLHGRLSTTEWMFYAFDTLPLFICIATYVPFWPGRFIPSVDAHIGPNEKEMQLEAMDPSENASRNRPVNA